MPEASLKNSWVVAKLLVSLTIICLLGRYIVQHQDDFFAIGDIGLAGAAFLITAQAALVIISATQFFVTARFFSAQLPYYPWVLIYVYSRLLNFFIPQAGNAYRLTALKIQHRFPLSAFALALVAYSYLNSLATAIYVWLTILVFDPTIMWRGYSLVVLIGLGIVLVLVGSLSIVVFQKKLAEKLANRFTRIMELARVLHDLCFSRKGLVCVATVLAWGFFSYLINMAINHFCFARLTIEIPVSHLALLRLANSVMDTVAITPGNIGIREALYGLVNREINGFVSGGIIVAVWLNVATLGGLVILGSISVGHRLLNAYRQ